MCVVVGFVGIVILVCYFIRILLLNDENKVLSTVYDEEGSITVSQETQRWGSEVFVWDSVPNTGIRSKVHRA